MDMCASGDSEKMLNKSENMEINTRGNQQSNEDIAVANEFYGDDARNPNLSQDGAEVDLDNVGLRMTQNISSASTPKASPGKKILRVVSSPGRFIKTTLREGSTNSSVFSLVIVCLGAGTLTIPNVMYENGYYLGALLIVFGGLISAFAGYLIAYCAHKTNSSCYEEIALACLGKKWMKITSFCMLPCNIGFLASYFVVFKTYMPYSIELATGKKLPGFCGDTVGG